MRLREKLPNLTRFEKLLWCGSLLGIIAAYVAGSEKNLLTLIDSLIGVTALIFLAKGHVAGQILTVCFSILYGIISHSFQYYGEMATYLGMTAPIAVISIVTWLKNPSEKGENEVKVAEVTAKQLAVIALLTIVVTFLFYFISDWFGTANLIVSTVSVATSFAASALSVVRSPYYAIAYACNDIVLIVLWVLAAIENIGYLPMIMCFVIFFVNDIYGFINWQRMRRRQQA